MKSKPVVDAKRLTLRPGTLVVDKEIDDPNFGFKVNELHMYTEPMTYNSYDTIIEIGVFKFGIVIATCNIKEKNYQPQDWVLVLDSKSSRIGWTEASQLKVIKKPRNART